MPSPRLQAYAAQVVDVNGSLQVVPSAERRATHSTRRSERTGALEHIVVSGYSSSLCQKCWGGRMDGTLSGRWKIIFRASAAGPAVPGGGASCLP
jgi:hypothetical protein